VRLLVSIDNGGTLTDVCATDGTRTVHAKTLTTPHDLTECFVKGLETLSEKLYGEADLPRIVGAIDYIRYSTTQGTNAIVQRKGPRLGWLVDDAVVVERVRASAPELYDALVGERVQVVSLADGRPQQRELVRAMSALVSAGANRVIVGFGGDSAMAAEKAAKRVLYRSFPRHLLGAVPMLFATELSQVGGDARRVWAALVNSFLHPAMEQFLYNAENRLRAHRARKPLLIFRNDGNSTRVAKTVAIKTYSSGPQGGVVGAQVLLAHYGVDSAVSIDIGGTTTDIAVFDRGCARVRDFGEIEGAPVPIPLSDVASIGAGGGSIIRAENGIVRVGPESVGSAPGPACFGRGGTLATMTDALLLEGILDPKSFFGGRLPLDAERAERAVRKHVAEPLGLDLHGAIDAMLEAYHRKIAAALPRGAEGHLPQILMAFGGAGPMSACGVAEQADLRQILIPRYAAVFCAYGISFSDIQHSYVAPLSTAKGIEAARKELVEQARRGMLAEGFELDGCTLDYSLLQPEGDAFRRSALNGKAVKLAGDAWLELHATRPIDKLKLGGNDVSERRKATPAGLRAGRQTLPVYLLEEMQPGDWGEGPCLVEEAFFTTHIRPGWRFTISDSGDIFVRR